MIDKSLQHYNSLDFVSLFLIKETEKIDWLLLSEIRLQLKEVDQNQDT